MLSRRADGAPLAVSVEATVDARRAARRRRGGRLPDRHRGADQRDPALDATSATVDLAVEGRPGRRSTTTASNVGGRVAAGRRADLDPRAGRRARRSVHDRTTTARAGGSTSGSLSRRSWRSQSPATGDGIGDGRTMSLRIVVADDHTMVQEGLRALLSTVDGYELVGRPDRRRRRSAPRSPSGPTSW